MKYWGINQVKDVWGLFTENYKIVLREIKDLREWSNIPCSSIGRLNIIEQYIQPNWSAYTDLIKTKSRLSLEIDRLILRLVEIHKSLEQ